MRQLHSHGLLTIILFILLAFFVANGASAGEQPVRGGVLNLTLNSDFRVLDPAYAGDGQTIKAVQLLFAGLLKYAAGTRGELVGNLAESWQWSQGRQGVTFKLRPGLKFSDGSPLTADDVAFSFTRILDPKTKAPYQRTFDVIKGAVEFIEGKIDKVAGIVVIDPLTVRFDLVKPVPYFLNLVGLPTAGIVSAQAVRKYGETFGLEHPVGAGPFILQKWARGEELNLTRNPYYYRPEMPYIDAVRFKLGISENLEMMMFQRGETDLVAPVSSPDFAKVMADPKLKASYFKSAGPRVFYIGMNWEMPPFNNKLVRLALNYAVDKERLIQLVNGRGIISRGIIPVWVPGYDETLAPYPYDPEKAKKLLAEAGHPNGFETDFYVPVYFDQPKIASAVQSDLAKVGVKLNIKQQAYQVFRQTLSQRGVVPIFALQWATDFPDAQNILSLLFSGATRGRPNFTWHFNPEVDKLLSEADIAQDPQKRLELYRQAQMIIWNDPPWIFEFGGVADGVKNPKLKPDVASYYREPTSYQHFDEVWKQK